MGEEATVSGEVKSLPGSKRKQSPPASTDLHISQIAAWKERHRFFNLSQSRWSCKMQPKSACKTLLNCHLTLRNWRVFLSVKILQKYHSRIVCRKFSLSLSRRVWVTLNKLLGMSLKTQQEEINKHASLLLLSWNISELVLSLITFYLFSAILFEISL